MINGSHTLHTYQRAMFVALVACSPTLLGCVGKLAFIRDKLDFSIIDTGPSSSPTPTVSWFDSQKAIGYTLKVSSSPGCENAIQEYIRIPDKSQKISPLANGTYYLCLSRTRGVTSSIADNSGLALVVNAPVATINNAPSGYNASTKLDVSISGGEFYKHKLVATATGCSEEKGYSQEQPVSKKITDSINLKDTYAYTLCVVARDSQGNWQDFTFASKASWNLFRLSFTGKSSPTASISDRIFKDDASGSTTWTLTGLCDSSLGNIAVGGSGLNATTSVSCAKDGTWSLVVNHSGTTSPYLWNYEGTVINGAKTITISQLGTPVVSTKLYQASYLAANLILISDVKSLSDAMNAGFGTADYAVQTADIDLTGVSLPYVIAPAVFEGNGFAISNFSSSTSFFQTAYTISNMRMENVRILSSAVGAVLGGIAAGLAAPSSIIGAFTSGSVETTDNTSMVGGLIGSTAFPLIVRSSSKARMSGGNRLGGIVASISFGTIAQVFYEGQITASITSTAGLLIGLNNNGTIKNSYAIGSVTQTVSGHTAFSGSGGLSGRFIGGAMVTCFVNATVSAQVATNRTDFIIGNVGGGTVTNTFYSSDSSCTFNSGTICPGTYGTAKTSSQLKQKATFTGFDFDSANPVWKIVEGVSSPTLTWQ